jgi:hypothetical protein
MAIKRRCVPILSALLSWLGALEQCKDTSLTHIETARNFPSHRGSDSGQRHIGPHITHLGPCPRVAPRGRTRQRISLRS